MAINTYSNISAFVNTVWEDSALVLREQGPMLGLVSRFGDRNDMAVRSNAYYGTAVINLIGESDDLSSQVLTPTTLSTLTPYEYGAQFFLTDQRLDSDIFGIRQDAAMELGGAYGQKVDGLLSGLFSSLTGGSIGGTTLMTWATFFGAETLLRIAKVPRPYVCVLSPSQWHSLGTAIAPGVTVTNAPQLQDQFAKSFYVASAGGVDIVVDGNIGTATAVYGAMFGRRALAFDMRRAPRIEWERDASRRGYELNFSSIFAYSTWRPAEGVYIYTSGSAPV
jgi:hypothetical protein